MFHRLDKPLLMLSILFTILGLVMILSASSVSTVLMYEVSSSYFFNRQLIIMIASYIIGLFILRIPLSRYKFFIPFYTISVIIFLIVVKTYGVIVNGAQSWISLGFFNLQPSEFAKTAIILFMAYFYEASLKKEKPLWYNSLPLLVSFIMLVLVVSQPDLGGAIIIAGITFLLYMKIPFSKKDKLIIYKVLGALVVIFALVYAYKGNSLLSAHQLARLNYQNPCTRYEENTGYQVCNGFIAIHNGGLTGLGLGNSTQKYLYLPEAHTDFIFPILVEELGVIIAIIIILLYLYMLYRILAIAKKADSIRNTIICYGTFAYLSLHLIVNFMGVLALIPLTGVPLPFLSYGGSFNINVVIMIFMVLRVSIETSINDERRASRNIR